MLYGSGERGKSKENTKVITPNKNEVKPGTYVLMFLSTLASMAAIGYLLYQAGILYGLW